MFILLSQSWYVLAIPSLFSPLRGQRDGSGFSSELSRISKTNWYVGWYPPYQYNELLPPK